MRFATVAATLSAVAIAVPLAGMDSHIVGPRALGMGGAGTAATDDHSAAFWNPGMYGFFGRTGEKGERLAADPNHVGRKDWGLGLVDAGVQVEVRGRLADLVQQIADIDLDKLSNLGSTAPSNEDLKAVMATLALVEDFTPRRDTVLLTANAGVGLRVGRFGIGLRLLSEGVLSVADLDDVNIGFGTDTFANIALDINNPAIAPDGWTAGHTPTLITGATATSVTNALLAAGATAPQAAEALSKLDYAAGQAGLTQADLDALGGAGGALVNAIAASGNAATSIDNNTTAAFTAGYSLAEIPLTYGHPVSDHLAVGGSLKLMVGRVAGAKIRLVEETSEVADLLQDAFENAEQTVTAGLDLGVVLRNGWGQIGLTGRNLNRPVLKGGTYTDASGGRFKIDDVDLDPQVALGVAVFPWETLCLTADVDLIENTTTLRTTNLETLPAGIDPVLEIEYASQRLALGAEWNILHFLALRGGVSRDLAESESGAMLHAGLGLNLWAMRLDFAGAMSTETVTVDGEDYPRAFNLGLGVSVDF